MELLSTENKKWYSEGSTVFHLKSKDKKNKDYFNWYSYNNDILKMCPAPGIYKHQYCSSINAPLFIKHSLLKTPHRVSVYE